MRSARLYAADPMATASVARCVAALALVATGAGCQTFVGIEDAEAHLPRLDGDYLVAITRLRADGTPDIIRLRGTASLDLATRTLAFTGNMLAFASNTAVSETSITDIEFPTDGDEVEVVLNLAIRPEAIAATPPPAPADLNLTVPVRFIAEADYAFCAKAVAGQPAVTLGSLLVDDLAQLPAPPDTDCDDPLRD